MGSGCFHLRTPDLRVHGSIPETAAGNITRGRALSLFFLCDTFNLPYVRVLSHGASFESLRLCDLGLEGARTRTRTRAFERNFFEDFISALVRVVSPTRREHNTRDANT